MSAVDARHYEQRALWGEDRVVLPEAVRQRIDVLVDMVPAGGGPVVDVGAGDGRVLHALAARDAGRPLVAAERAMLALVHVRTLGVQASADALPFADRSVQVAMCCEVLEHLPTPVLAATRRELARIADDAIVISVPNREHRRRADVTCPECGCRYHRERHLRSFTPDDLPELFDGFRLVATTEVGPRPPTYPRLLRTSLERLGVMRPPGSPSCPQCGALYTGRRGAEPSVDSRPADAGAAPAISATAPDGGGEGGDAGLGYRVLRTVTPKSRHPYWLCAAYRRR